MLGQTRPTYMTKKFNGSIEYTHIIFTYRFEIPRPRDQPFTTDRIVGNHWLEYSARIKDNRQKVHLQYAPIHDRFSNFLRMNSGRLVRKFSCSGDVRSACTPADC